MDFFRRGRREEAKSSDSSSSSSVSSSSSSPSVSQEENKPIWNQDATVLPKDSQQAITSIISTLTKEKNYSDEVVSRAMSEYIKGLEGQTENDKLANLVSSSNRTVNVRRMCIKALLIESFQDSDLDSMARVELWAHALFTKLEIRDNESLNKYSSRYLLKLCSAISEVISEGEYKDEDLIITLSRKEYFPPLYWSVSELNRQPLGTLPSERELVGQLKRGAQVVCSLRSRAIDLEDILSMLISGPHHFTGVIPVLMHPLLSESKNPKESNKHLEASLEKITKLIVWNDKTIPGTIANLQKHPGIPLASEVAKCLPFEELYKVFVNVAFKLLFTKGRGFDKCDMKLNYRLGNMTFGELRRLSFTAASAVTDMMAERGMDMEDPAKKGSSPMDGYKSNEEALCVRDFRRLFDLSPEAYDKDGKSIAEYSEKNRAHSFVASVLLVPFLKGLYEARAKFLDFNLNIDAPFLLRIQELEKERDETKSLDEKRLLKKTIASLRRLHARVVNVIQECVGENKTKIGLELDLALSSASQFSLKESKLKKSALRDISELQKCPEKKPGEARQLVEMAKDAPEWAQNVPTSPWTPFFSETLVSIEEKLRDPAAVHDHMDEFSSLISDQLSAMVASAISESEEKDALLHDEDLRAVVKTVIDLALAKQKMKVNSKIVDLLRDVFFYVQCYPKTKTPDHICLKVIQISRPLIKTLMEYLHQVNGADLFKSLKETIHQNKNKPQPQ